MTCLQHLWHSLACTARQQPSARRQRLTVRTRKGKRVPWRAKRVQQYLQCYELCQSQSIPYLHPSIDQTRCPSCLLANISTSSYCCKGFIGPLPTNTDSKMLWCTAFRLNAMCPSIHLFPTGLMALRTWTLILLVTIHMICPLYLLCFYTPFVLEMTQYMLVWPVWLKMMCCLLHSLVRHEISTYPNIHSFTWLICFFRVQKAMPSKIKQSKAFANLLM